MIWNNKAKIVPRCSLLQIVMPSSCEICGQIPEWISSQKGLYLLDLSGNNLEWILLYWLAEMNIPTIVLFVNQLTGSILPRLFESTRLMILQLSHNNFSGKLPENIGNAQAMAILMLSRNHFSGQIPISMSNVLNQPRAFRLIQKQPNSSSSSPKKQLIPLKDLSHEQSPTSLISEFLISPAGNKLIGSIPLEIANFTRMIETPVHMSTSSLIFNQTSDFYISENNDQIDIEIEDLIVNWKSYFQGLLSHSLDIYPFLDLSNNRISGQIPALLGNLQGLKVLNISNNNISGRSQSLAKLGELTILDMSNKKLTGKIPLGGQMNTMNELKYFAINNGFCGMQIKITEDIPPTRRG
ncbi:hypothetical protein L6452_23939 [Arctium lappa]|uniref:Uncharacterized protein n=1 Tax=Arctium lappa TaxID=4217 RepID=A0ACB9A8X4_ARCLA|nr:hypothetical protein L6452_23939 [Arctium lappa]